jgi:hypothetical protein
VAGLQLAGGGVRAALYTLWAVATAAGFLAVLGLFCELASTR